MEQVGNNWNWKRQGAGGAAIRGASGEWHDRSLGAGWNSEIQAGQQARRNQTGNNSGKALKAYLRGNEFQHTKATS